MKIAILGAGSVGGTLGGRWSSSHEVVFGVREGSSRSLPAGASSASIRDAVAGAEVVVLATPWPAVPDALKSAGDLSGKVLLDATNPLGAGMKLDVGPNGESGAERIAAMAPGARVVKVFNTTGFGNMADPSYGGEPTVMFYAGDDAAAKDVARQLALDLGFDAIDAGGLERARQLEHLAALWIGLAYGGHGRDIAFRLVRR